MLLSEWGGEAPSGGCMNQAVLDVLGAVLYDMGAGDNPECWVAWGDDPEYRYSVLAPTAAGLVTVAVRLNPGEGRPRATAKLVRWSKLQMGEFAIEATDEHRVVAVQVEGLVLKGTDDQAARICEFVRGLMAGVDGRAFASAGPMVVQAMPAAAAPAAAARAPGKSPKTAAPDGTEAAPAPKGGRKGGKAAKQEQEQEQDQEAAWVPPHPIPVAGEPAAPAPAAPAPAAPAPPQPAPPQPAQPVPQPAPPAPEPSPVQPAQPRPPTRESGSVWEVPEVDPATRDQRKPRTWRP